MKRFYYLFGGLLLAITFILPAASFAQRVEGPIILYTFDTVENGNIIKDVSGVEPIVDLEMTEGVTKISDRNGVNIADPLGYYDQGLFSTTAPAGLNAAIQATNALTVEFWGLPMDFEHDDARLITYSFDGGHRNFSLMLEYDEIETRLRTTVSGVNGYNPNWIAGSPQPGQTPSAPFHVVWTYNAGYEVIYFNGELMDDFLERGDDITNWDDTYKLVIGIEDNNADPKRQYEGDVYMVAIYDKELSADDVKTNFDAGSVSNSSPVDDIASSPSIFELAQNYPNPFNPETTIRFTLTQKSATRLKVFNTSGQEIVTLVNSELQPGSFDIQWNGKDALGNSVPGGLYIYSLEAEGVVKTNKMLLLK